MENKHEISGIKCNVTNCVYHAKNNACEAGMIEVGPCDTCNCTTDTCCNTFKAKNQFNYVSGARWFRTPLFLLFNSKIT